MYIYTCIYNTYIHTRSFVVGAVEGDFGTYKVSEKLVEIQATVCNLGKKWMHGIVRT